MILKHSDQASAIRRSSSAFAAPMPRIESGTNVRRLANLKSELKITDAQADVWQAYAEAIKARVNVMQSMRIGMMDAMDKGGAIERMDIRIKGMEAMVESMKAVKPATDKLYAALTAEQKKVADQLIGVDCGAM